jgi:predicted transcriptional regulator
METGRQSVLRKLANEEDSMTDGKANADKLTGLTVDIVSAYVSNNPVQRTELANLISSVRQSLGGAGRAPEPVVAALSPAVPIRKSVHGDYIVCLEDGKKFKSLKRHLGVHYGMTPEEYRQKWGLPADYPMVAPNYAATRSELAKKIGLGRKQAKKHSSSRGKAKA